MYRAIMLGATMAVVAGLSAAALAQTPAPAPTEDPVAATVDGSEIRGSDVAAMFHSLPAQYRQLPMEMLYKQLLDRLIEQRIVAMAARKEGLLDDPDVKRRLAFITESVLHQLYIERAIDKAVDDNALRAAYEKKKAQSSGATEVRARHILVKTEAEAVIIIREIQGGADFAETARNKSIGPSKSQGGDLGFFGPGQMVPEFSEAAFKLNPGEVTSEPVKTQFGWHIIKVEERRAAGVSSFEESKDELRQAMIQETVRKTVSGLREKADVKILQGGGIQRVQ